MMQNISLSLSDYNAAAVLIHQTIERDIASSGCS